MPGVYLFISDGNSNPIYLDDEAAKLSRAIQEYRQSFLSNYIRLEYKCATKEALSLVADFCKTHAAADDDLKEWTSNLKNLDLSELKDIMEAAKYLEIKGLMGFCNTAVARKLEFVQKIPVEYFEIQKEEIDLFSSQMNRKREEEARKREEEARKREQEELMKKLGDHQKELEDEEEEMRSLDELHRIVAESMEDQEEHGIVEESTEDQEEHGIVEENTEDQEDGGNEDSG